MDPQEMSDELGHPGAQDLLASATLLRLVYVRWAEARGLWFLGGRVCVRGRGSLPGAAYAAGRTRA